MHESEGRPNFKPLALWHIPIIKEDTQYQKIKKIIK